MKTLYALAFLSVFFFSCSTTTYAVDLKDIEKQLSTTGCTGWIHGAVADQSMYVFTYRNPKDFFDYIEMSLVSEDPEMMKKFAEFSRQDEVKVKGAFMDNPSPQKHINVSSIEMVKKYKQPYKTEPYEHEAKIPNDLVGKTNEVFMVHAVGGDGHILVVEYKDAVLPIFVENAAFTKNLYRNDVVNLKFGFQDEPDRPVHLVLTETDPQPVTVLDSIQAKNGKPAVLEGALIMFPKSPEIKFNVFAVQELLDNGLNRQYTLINMDNPKVFTQIREALQKEWDKFPGQYTNGRNKLLNKQIRVKVTGIYNEVDPSQANPQILLSSVDSIVFEEK
jgi:hypothetical protein